MRHHSMACLIVIALRGLRENTDKYFYGIDALSQ
jgi:hypothetical protein